MDIHASASDAHPLLRLFAHEEPVEGLVDEAGEPYSLLRLELPKGVVAEIDDGAYGELVGLRIYGQDGGA